MAMGSQLSERGLVFLVDRTVDPLIMLMHPISYQVRSAVDDSLHSRW